MHHSHGRQVRVTGLVCTQTAFRRTQGTMGRQLRPSRTPKKWDQWLQKSVGNCA